MTSHDELRSRLFESMREFETLKDTKLTEDTNIIKKMKNSKNKIRRLIAKLKDTLNDYDISQLLLDIEIRIRIDQRADNLRHQLITDDTDYTIDIITTTLVAYRQYAFFEAHINWITCSDPNGTSLDMLAHQENLDKVLVNIYKHKNGLGICFSKDEIEQIIIEGEKMKTTYQEEIESKIERDHRPTGIIFNEKTLFIRTDTIIPQDIKILLSFGYTFLSPYVVKDKNMFEILAQLEMTIEQAIPEGRQREVSFDIYRILKNKDSILEDGNKQWLKFVTNRAINFFKNNEDILPTKSDKGGHTVVLDVCDYEEKLSHLLPDRNSYIEIMNDPLADLIKKEKHLIGYLSNKTQTKQFFEGVTPFEPKTLGLPKFYGLPKIPEDRNKLA